MQKYIFLILAILISHNSHLYSQSGWMAQQSGTPVKLNKVFFINSQTGWVVGDSGKILKTTNEGANWFSQNSNTNHTLVSVQFINESTGYIAGGNKNLFTFSFIKILKTTNERLSSPGKIAIVYSHDNEAEEYKQYINFLKTKNYITSEVESFELADMQGVHGLKALRISVNSNFVIDKNNEDRIIDQTLKTTREYIDSLKN